MPLAGMQVRRELRLAKATAVLSVPESVTNTNKRGRIFNMVQHPTIAPPFLDETTIVDSNAQHGFSQADKPPISKAVASSWPKMRLDGQDDDLRLFKGIDDKSATNDVSSFVFRETDKYGWVTACNARQGLLLGYLWRTAEYPWLNIWRYREKGRVAARGLEFGTTGYHQPFGTLVKTGRILDRRLYEHLDAGQTIRKTYVVFLAEIPRDFAGVTRLEYDGTSLTLTERRSTKPRRITVAAGLVLGDI